MHHTKNFIYRRLPVLCLTIVLLVALPGTAWGNGINSVSWTCNQNNGYFNEWPSPFSGTVSGSVVGAVYAAVYDSAGIRSEWTEANLTVQESVYNWSVSVDSDLPDAAYQLKTMAYGTTGQPYSDDVGVFNFGYDTTVPYVSIESVNPTNPIAGQPFTVVAAVYDVHSAGGYASGIASVQFSVDGTVVDAVYQDGTYTGELTVNTAGNYNLVVKAFDKAGNPTEVNQPIMVEEGESAVASSSGDEDNVFFDGDNITITMSNLPSALNGQQVRIALGVYKGVQEFDTSKQVVNNMSFDSSKGYHYVTDTVSGGSVTVSGTVYNPNNTTLPSGCIALKIYSTDGTQDYTPNATPVVNSSGRPAIVGVYIPDGEITASPPLKDFTNLYNTKQSITFTKADLGSIEFPAGLDIINHRHELENLQNGITLTFENGALVGGVDTGSLTFLANKGATIRFFGAMEKLGLEGITADNFRDYLEVTVEENGQAVTDIAEYIDLAQMSYDRDTDTLVMPVKHFTTFIVRRGTTPSDTTNPAVIATDPSHDATGVAVDKTITVTFSEEIQQGGAYGDIALEDAAGNPVEFSTSINGSILTIDPVNNLAYSTTYTVMIPHDAVEDLAYLPFGDENGYSFSFTTRSRPSSSGGSGGSRTVTRPPAPEPKVEGDSADVSECVSMEKETNADGTTTVNVTLKESAVKKALAAGEAIKEVVLEIAETADNQVVTVPAGAFSKLAEKQASLVLKTGKANLIIPGDAINIDRLAQQLGVSTNQVQVNIQVKEVPVETARHLTAKAAADAALKPVGRVLQFNLEAKAGEKNVGISSFGNKRVRGEFLLTPEELKNVGDLRKLNVYRFDEAGQQWNYVWSKVDVANKKVIFITNSFSNYTVMEYDKTFADVRGHWAKEDVELMASKYVVKGKTQELFSPEDKVTRAEFATLLVRALGLSEERPARDRFSDVAPDAWYSGSVEAAARAGLVKGMGNGRFAPDDQITREQMAVMIVRALEQTGFEVTISEEEQEQLLARFSDRAKIQNWAAADLVRAVKSGLLKGVTATTIEPAANATRAQAAVMIKRMMEKAGLL